MSGTKIPVAASSTARRMTSMHAKAVDGIKLSDNFQPATACKSVAPGYHKLRTTWKPILKIFKSYNLGGISKNEKGNRKYQIPLSSFIVLSFLNFKSDEPKC